MRVLQIGGGSMGTRRMRDLRVRPGIEIRLLDGREDRRARALAAFGIVGFNSLDEALAWDPEIFIVSTPPDQHSDLVRLALDTGRHVFSEADIWPSQPEAEAIAERGGVVFAPSATLLFHPVVEEVARIVRHELGAVHAFGYLLSVDAPSWHPGEGQEYYARHRATAPAREMTAFELIGLHGIVGPTRSVSGRVEKRGTLDGDAEDTYCLQLVTETGAVGQLSVLMASPQVARRGWVAGENGVVAFDLLAGSVERRLPGARTDDVRHIADWAEVLEQVYDAEISAFISAVEGTGSWPFSGRASLNVCSTLAAAELSMLTGRHETVRPGLVPAAHPTMYEIP
ncbi:unannotated protein [freshwater metagenome]|uniref:Unannotated protein n=1 Tax=freshwater metagenome TaxID=449393 RepID=A0A6J7C667_9ZZZZ